MRVGIVVEGTHDFYMLRPLISEEISTRFNEPVEFVELQPEPDATGAYSDGGWTRVLAWCKLYSGDAIDTFFTPLFNNNPECDVIIVHLDGDVLEHCGPHTSVVIPAGPIEVAARVEVVAQILLEWLACPTDIRSRIAFAIPVLQTEAWMIAGRPSCSLNWEVCDAKTVFRASYNPGQYGPLRTFYASEALVSAAHRNTIFARCVSYQLFVDEVSALKRQ